MADRSSGASRRTFIVQATAAMGALTWPGPLRLALEPPIVPTGSGRVRGLVNQAGVHVFKGIPYAASTAGKGRFRPPTRVRPWRDVRECAKAGPIAPQNDDDRTGVYAQYPQGEDCLNLNIWTPAIDRGKRPVVVFMHGGGFATGSGSLGLYDGTALARDHDVVVVTINYRLGLLGFPPFQLFGPHTSSNLGVLDCVAALEWVRHNIEAFGGDPHRVLQCGQSAGAMISATLGVLPQARGLFQRAVPMSMQTLVTVDRERQARYTRELVDALKLGRNDLGRLATLSVPELLAAQKVVRDKGIAAPDRADQLRWPFMLNHDDVVLAEDPGRMISEGRLADVPILIGATAEELVLTPATERANPTAKERAQKDACLTGLAKQLGAERAPAIWDRYRAEYPEASDSDLCGLIGTDQFYRVPAIRIAEARAARRNAWTYTMAYRGSSPYFTNAHHAIDLPFWFGTLIYPPVFGFFLGHTPTEAELALSRRMQGALAGLAKSGKLDWPAYDLTDRATMIFDVESQVTKDPRPTTRETWTGLVR